MTATSQLKSVPLDDLDKEIGETSQAMDLARVSDAMVHQGEIVPVLASDTRWNDIANAERFLMHFGENLRYCVEADKWMIYADGYWQTDHKYDIAEFARRFVKRELEDALADPRKDKERRRNAERINNRAGFNAMLDMAMQLRAIRISEFDSERTHYLLNCKNGTLDLKSGKLNDHNREDFITRVIDVDYDEKAECPHFDRFMGEIQPDADVRGFLQRSMGYTLLGAVPEHAFWILYGIGNNGKSVFTKLFMNLLGPYSSGMQAESLMESKRAAGAASEDIARLKAKRYVLVSESNDGERINAAQIKALSAGDVVTARELFKGSFDFAFTGKLWIATNHKPQITDPSKGMWRRVKLVPFTQNIPDDRIVRQDELHARFRSEFSGILNWAVRGCLKYIKDDSLSTPEVIEKEIAQYKFEQDSIAQFLMECCETIDQALAIAEPVGGYVNALDYRAGNTPLYEAYVKYCKNAGERYPRTQRRFTQNLQERGFKQMNSAGRYWEGLRLNEVN